MLDKKPDHFDGLVAEWIGEVGQLHQKIQQLPKAMDEALLPTMRLLNDLSKQLNSLHSTNDELLRKTMGNRVEVESYSMQSIHLPSNPISSLQTMLIAGLSFGFGFGAQAIHLSAIGAATVGITVGVLVSQATLFFQKNQENRLKLVKPKQSSTSWSDADFQRATVNTKISIRTVAACRDVLVDNASIGAAAITHQILPGQIYKALPEFREREMLTRK